MKKLLLILALVGSVAKAAQSNPIVLTNLSQLPVLSSANTNLLNYVVEVTTNGLGALVYTPRKQVPTVVMAGTNVVLTTNGNILNINSTATGGGGSPGGSSLQLQFNNSGSFGGANGIITDAAGKTNLSVAGTHTANTVVGTNGVSGLSFTGTGPTANSEIDLPNDAATFYFSLQAYDTASANVRWIAPPAAFSGMGYWNMQSTNMFLTNLTIGSGLNLTGTTLSATGLSDNWVASGSTNSTLPGTASVYALVITNSLSVLNPSGPAIVNFGDTDDSNWFAWEAYPTITTNIAFISPPFPLPTASLMKVVTSGTVTNTAGTVYIAQYITNAIAGTDYSTFAGTSGTVVNTGASLANQLPVYSNTTGTNLVPSTSVIIAGDASSATETFTFNLSGATDPVWTAGNNSMDLTTGVLKYAGNTVATSANNLSFFSATTSAQLAALLSDETGSGLAVFGTSPTIVTPTIASFVNATHNHQNAAGGGTLAESALALTDITTDNVSTSAHGFAPKLPNDATKYFDGTGVYSVPAGSGSSGANPTASVGLAAVNGVAATFLRSDGAPALSQSIAPTWTAGHIFNAASGIPVSITPAANTTAQVISGGSTTGSGTTKGATFSHTANTSGNIDGVWTFGMTDTASGSTTKVLQVFGGVSGTTSLFNVDKNGITIAASAVRSATGISGSGFIGSGGLGIISRGVLAASGDGIMNFQDSAGTGFTSLQLGPSDATPNSASLLSPSGVGTDIAGGDLTIAGGQSTGTGTGGSVITKTSLSSTTGSSANSYSIRSYESAKSVSLTESSATLFANIALASGKYLGAKLICTVNADDGTDFQALTSEIAFSAVNKAGTIPAITVTEVDGTANVSSGTLTAAYTAVVNGNGVDIKCNAVSSLTQTTLKCRWMIIALNSDGVATVTPQ